MKQVFFSIIILLLLAGCKPPVKTKALTDEYAVINLALQNAVLPDDVFQRREREAYNPDSIKSWMPDDEFKQRQHTYDSVKKLVDNSIPSLFIRDTLYRSIPNRFDYYKTATGNGYFASQIKNLTTVKQIAKAVDTVTITHKMDIKQIDPIYEYRLFYLQKNEHVPKNILYFGTIRITSPCFNTQRTMACLTLQLKCGGLCGHMSDFFMIKKNKHWELVDKVMTTVY